MGTKNITGQSIPTQGLGAKAMLYVEHTCGERKVSRFVVNGLIFLLCKEFPTIFGSWIRPVIYRWVLSSVGTGCLIERSVRLEVPSRITLGNRVVLSQNCWISPGSALGNIRFGDDTFVAHGSTLRAEGGSIEIGAHVQVSRNCYLNGCGGITIGNDTMLGPNTTIVSVNHKYDQLDRPIRLQGIVKDPVVIENDVWTGANVTILPGITIGRGSVVAAGAVVTKDIPPYSVAAGVPAKIVSSRKQDQ